MLDITFLVNWKYTLKTVHLQLVYERLHVLKMKGLNKTTITEEWCLLTRATQRNNPEDTILHSHRRENLKFYTITEYMLCIE
jgi:hypothetical protein